MSEISLSSEIPKKLPDVALDKPVAKGVLAQVGMSGIELPLTLKDENSNSYRVAGKADAYVSLDAAEARGIHMSRLFRQVQSALPTEPLTLQLLAKTAEEFLETHAELSVKAWLAVEFSALVDRKSLKSENHGWRTYPVRYSIEATRGQASRAFVEILVTYSSTCPASAALARQLVQENFTQSFANETLLRSDINKWLGSTEGINATPHAQRSYAKLKVELDAKKTVGNAHLPWINLVEEALGTPVQTAVKREDEQEFALRNGQNLMFCEDAARRVQTALVKATEVLSFSGEFRHVESLHPHDAVARIEGQKSPAMKLN